MDMDEVMVPSKHQNLPDLLRQLKNLTVIYPNSAGIKFQHAYYRNQLDAMYNTSDLATIPRRVNILASEHFFFV